MEKNKAGKREQVFMGGYNRDKLAKEGLTEGNLNSY